MRRSIGELLALAFAAVAASADCTGIKAISPKCSSKEAAFRRDYFYIGGEYVYEASFKSSIVSDQMYVEKLTPSNGVGQLYPLVLITVGVPLGAVQNKYLHLCDSCAANGFN